MPEFTAIFDRPFQRKEFAYRDNVEGYLMKTLRRYGNKVTSIEYSMRGNKTKGYTLRAKITYKSERELDPRMLEVPAGWKPVYDEKKWRERRKRDLEANLGQEKARELVPHWYEGEDQDDEEEE